MSEPYIIFKNQGVMDPRSMKTFGVSVKEGSNPIGFFGTGLKYAIAILLRLNQKVEILAGEEVFKFSTKKTLVRGKEFDLVTMNGEEMPFTTELGKTWEAWQAFRELYCNCLDEQGEVYLNDLLPLAREGYTHVVIRGHESSLAFAERDSIVLNLAESLVLKRGEITIYNTPSRHLYYRGIRVAELNKPSLLTYNIIASSELTEDRTLKNPYSATCKLPMALAGLTNKAVLKKILTCSTDDYERLIDFGNLDWYHDVESDEFQEVLNELWESNNDKLNSSARAYFVKVKDKNASKHYQKEELTSIEDAQLTKCLAICSDIFPQFNEYPVMVVKTLGTKTYALADRENMTMVISKECFRRGTKYLLSTLIEEYTHLYTGFNDHTRELQTHLFDQITTLIETYVYKEPI